MKLIGYKENFQLFSGKASDGARQLGFAGIALIWIFSGGRPASPRQPEQLRLPLALLVFALGLDLLQCTVQTIILSCFHRYHEKTRYIDEDPEKVAPPYLNGQVIPFLF